MLWKEERCWGLLDECGRRRSGLSRSSAIGELGERKGWVWVRRAWGRKFRGETEGEVGRYEVQEVGKAERSNVDDREIYS